MPSLCLMEKGKEGRHRRAIGNLVMQLGAKRISAYVKGRMRRKAKKQEEWLSLQEISLIFVSKILGRKESQEISIVRRGLFFFTLSTLVVLANVRGMVREITPKSMREGIKRKDGIIFGFFGRRSFLCKWYFTLSWVHAGKVCDPGE